MNVKATIKTALSSLGLPVMFGRYEGTATEYITFNYSDDRPALNADDTDLYSDISLQIHYYTKGDAESNKKNIRRLIRAAGFSIVSTAQLYEDDTEYNHVIIEINIEIEVDD